MTDVRGAKVEAACEWCRQKFEARIADRKRGWARFCSKTCKASEQEKRTGANAAFKARLSASESQGYRYPDDEADPSWDSHKDWFGTRGQP